MSAFDTHWGYQGLVEAGVPEKQADAHVNLLTNVVEENLVTRDFLRAELQELRQEMRKSDAALERKLQERDASLRQELQERDASLRQQLQEQDTSLRQELQEQGASLRQELHDLDASLRQELQERDAGLWREIAAIRENMVTTEKNMATMENRIKDRLSNTVILCTTILGILIAVFGFFG